MDSEVFGLLIVSALILAFAAAISFVGVEKVKASANLASPITGICAILMALFPVYIGLAVLISALPELMKPARASPTPTLRDIAPFISLICVVAAGVYLLAAANTFYRPQIAWRLHFVLAFPWAIYLIVVLFVIATSIADGSLAQSRSQMEPQGWQSLLYLYPFAIAPFHCFFAFRDTWWAFRKNPPEQE